MKQKRKLRIFISNTFYPAKESGEGGGQEEGSVASWELRVEGRLLEDTTKSDPNKVRILPFFFDDTLQSSPSFRS